MTCQILKNRLTHTFVTDPKINIDDLRPNKQTIEKLKEFVTTERNCSIVTDIQVFNTSFTTANFGPYSYTESIALQISANKNNIDVATIVTDLKICLAVFKNSIQLNESGVLRNNADLVTAEVDYNSCCHLIYGKPKTTNECCKLGFIQNRDNCGEFSHQIPER